ncbi:hypothetical protein LTR99_010312 [Exophiala xenobiotica]|uniref:Rhodopsin domain-containing protein n=1 Tax=Vermiconidia calcicola TaxID=1690605 RepID=A0AAV9Q692_9PEZI|nr:hypothetical protein LTR92_007105 [Exophiala xenobiotica]KAK5534031.1 hypothetical protein LTR25_007011 [Vermiconidia calcicola]KAK5538072.1 hypothetical protein LTR23_007209 [Chaetothyriales sp. CCFEE 6169]KAK5219456.1 hypothetical protein LTR72_007840 [Exophiala xenobiotica]KAK5264022.1 hypothetical protein LTR96_010530 [Exophiala xenobiotica]
MHGRRKACLYTILIVFLNIDLTVSTNLIDPAHPVDLTPHEIDKRTWGSKTVLLVEQCMCAIQWGTKVCLLLLYWRLTKNLKQAMVVKCAAAYVVATYVVMEVFYFALWCRPFHDYWQTPTNNTQCTTALHHLIMNLVFNLTSDVLILSIPLPLFITTHLEFKRKLLLIFPFSLGVFTMVCAILSKVASFNHPYSAVWVYWYCREASTAMIVSNMPYSWALFRRAFNLRSFFGDSSSDRMQEGRARELQGTSTGAIPLGSQPRSRQVSQPDQASGKFSWKHSALHKKQTVHNNPEEAATKPWDSGAAIKDKETDIETAGASSTDSSVGSMRKPPQSPTSDWTLDRLYPLDDDEEEDIGKLDVTQRRYDG